MSVKTSVIVKICSNATSFLVFGDKKIVSWSNAGGGEYHIINDVSQCLRLKFNDSEQLTKAKGVCLSEAVVIKEDQLLAEIIGARVEQIFNNIKDTLRAEKLMEDVTCFFITKDDNYLPDMDKLLSKVMEKPAKCIDPSMINVSVKASSEFSKLMDMYF